MAETFKGASLALSTTSVTDLYQCPSGAATDRSIVLSCHVANVTTGAVGITIIKTDSSNNVLSRLANVINVPVNAALELIQNKLVLESGQKLRAQASSANSLEVTLSALEIT